MMADAADRQRITSVDALRGAVMIVMALDHVRDFFHRAAMTHSPTQLATTTVAIFLTRWVTHICMPVFLFTAGMGACYWRRNGHRTTGELSWFLVTRGLWLLVLELTAMRLAFDFTFGRDLPVLLITLWALGMSMIALAALVHLQGRTLAVLSVGVLCLHNLLDPVRARTFGPLAWLWTLLHQPGAIPVGGVIVVVGYPILPLAAIMAAGYAFAAHVNLADPGSRAAVRRLGGWLCVAFVLLRGLNVYGDPVRWSVQPTAAMTVVSFLNTTKQPASLDFVLMTLGPALVLLAWLGTRHFSLRHPLIVFGRVPLFYFLGHFFLAHVLFIGVIWARYGIFTLRPPPSMGDTASLFPPDFGFPLLAAYLAWVVVVASMYPLCVWFGAFKTRHKTQAWTSYV
jgi:uncharacterized membrane protein